MISEKLQKAREFEQEQLSKISPEERPSFHVTGGTGWINDPNGLIYYKGNYHIFYQHFPYDNKWGTMHWGHAITKDFVNIEHLPNALYPTKDICNCSSLIESISPSTSSPIRNCLSISFIKSNCSSIFKIPP